jgi:Uri superfamily endonuclease
VSRDKGTYILVIELDREKRIRIGRLPAVIYKKGYYFYVGKAGKGFQGRIGRHLRKRKKSFWHIDYLLKESKIREVWIRKNYFDECRTIEDILRNFKIATRPVKYFGSSDCRCSGHLVHMKPSLADVDRASVFKSLGFERNI